VALDVYSNVTASDPLRRSTEAVSAWADAEIAGAGGAALGSVVPGVETA